MKKRGFVYKSDENDKEFFSALKIGDIVKVRNIGSCYTHYTNAFRHFGIENSCEAFIGGGPNALILKPPKNLTKTNWIVVNLAIHSYYNDILALLKSPSGEFLVLDCSVYEDTDESWDLMKNLTKKFENKFKTRNKNFILKRILK